MSHSYDPTTHEAVVVYLPRLQWERIATHFRAMQSPDDEYYGAPWEYWAGVIEAALANPGSVRKEPRLPGGWTEGR